jgi:hypothetical protein
MIGWICRRCGLGLICDDEPGHCGCWSRTAVHGTESEYDRVVLARVSPSRVGSVAIEALEGIRFALESGPVAVPEIEEALDLVDRYLAEFSRSSTDRPEQPEPDVLGGQAV